MTTSPNTRTLPFGEISPEAHRLFAEIERERWARMSADDRIHARLTYRWMCRDGVSRRRALAASKFLILAGCASERNRWAPVPESVEDTSGRDVVDHVLEESGRPWGEWEDCSIEIDAPALIG